MEYGLFCWEIAGFLFTVVFGALLHFAYRWSGRNSVAALFAPVNESTWEHLKLLFVPMTLFSIVEYFFVGSDYPNYIGAKALGIIIGMFAIVAIFYTYAGIAGKNFLWADILTFVLGAGTAYLYGWRVINEQPTGAYSDIMGMVLVLIFAVCFATFTFDPPHIPLLLDPVSRQYGIPKAERQSGGGKAAQN